MEAAVSLAGLSSGQQHGARVVGLVGVSSERWFQLCVAAVNVVGQHYGSGLRRYVKEKSLRCSAAGLGKEERLSRWVCEWDQQ